MAAIVVGPGVHNWSAELRLPDFARMMLVARLAR